MPNDLILKMLCMVAEALDEKSVALHATHGMLDKDADLTQGFLGHLVLFTSLRTWILFTLTRLLVREVNLLSTVIGLSPPLAQVDQNMQIEKPINIWGELLLQQAVIMVRATKGATEKPDECVRKGPHRIFQGMLFFFPRS